MKLIDKGKIVAELERRVEAIRAAFNEPGILSGVDRTYATAQYDAFESLLTFLDTLEVKEIYEHNDSDLDPILKKIGVETDSRTARMFKTAFYSSIDTYLAKKEK